MKSLKILVITAVVFIVDQITKYIIHHSMKLYESFKVLGDFFRITYVENTGMAFGIQVANSEFFTVFAVIASIAIMVYLFRMKGEHVLARLSMALILGGAIGNLWDRITRGSVVDFFDFDFFNVNIPSFRFLFIEFPGYAMERWPVFNVADMGISIGMGLLFVFILFEKEEEDMTDAGEAEIIR